MDHDNRYVLILRTCKSDMTSHNGFVWPESGPVECPNWNPEPVCGGGLHGWLWGEGNGVLGNWSKNAKWLVVRVLASDVVDLDGKVKFPRGEVVYCGPRFDATAYLAANGGAGKAVIGIALTGGHGSTLTGGDDSALTGGHGSTLTGGHGSTLTGGDGSTLTGGHGSTLTGGDDSALTGGDDSTLTGGDRSTLTGGDDSTLTGGDRSTLIFEYWCHRTGRKRIAVAYPGEDGIEPNVPYRCVDGKFVKAEGHS